jgi:hypothetical protein
MKKLLFICGILVVLSAKLVGQNQVYQNEIELNLKQFQKPNFFVSFFSYSGECKEQTYISKLICPEVQIKEHRRFRPKRKVETSRELIYKKINAQEAMNQFVSDILKTGKDAFVELKVIPELRIINTGSQVHKVPGYRIEGVALDL